MEVMMNQRNRTTQILLRGALLLVSVLFLSANAHAQADITLKRAVNNWPTIELYFTVSCDGDPRYFFNKDDDFAIYENGVEIGEFTLWCPDPRQRCAISVALVFDASGSMGGAGNAGAKAAGRAFIDQMDGIQDEAALIWFNSSVNLELSTTTNKAALYAAVDALPASGATAVWDGIYEGVQEVIATGSNPCRAVIAMTDGGDNSSRRTPPEIIALANRNRIRVFTVGLGGGVQEAQLQTIADLTGGRYYRSPSPDQLVSIYEEISTIIFKGFLECVITYQANCADGGIRSVELQLTDYCNSSDSDTRTYRAPKDTTTFEVVTFDIPEVSATGGSTVSVPLELISNFAPPRQLDHFDFVLEYDPQCLQFDDVYNGPGTILEGYQVQVVESQPGFVSFMFQGSTQLETSGVMCNFEFTAINPVDRVVCDLSMPFDEFIFHQGCFTPTLLEGSVTIDPSGAPTITTSNGRILCEGDSTTLTAEDGYTDILWSNGKTTKSIVVKTAGSYSYTAKDASDQTVQSTTLIVVVSPVPVPVLERDSQPVVCLGEEIELSTTRAWAKYLWSTGDTTPTIKATQTGTYWVQVETDIGCVGTSQPMSLSFVDPPEFMIEGDRNPCMGDYTYTVSRNDLDRHSWSVINGVMSTMPDEPTLTVRWDMNQSSGLIQLRGYLGECDYTDTMIVYLHGLESPTIQIMGDQPACHGDTVYLQVPDVFAAYRWDHGPTTHRVAITQPGNYRVEVENAVGCTVYSNEVIVGFYPEPPKPTITQNGEVLLASRGVTYQWKVDGAPVPNAMDQFFTPSVSGAVTVTVTDSSGCKATSDPFDYTVGIVPPGSIAEEFSVYPSPNDGIFTVRLTGVRDPLTVKVTNTIGQVVYESAIERTGDESSLRIDLTQYAPGVYNVLIDNGKHQQAKRVLVR